MGKNHEVQAPIARCVTGALVRNGKLLLVKRASHMRFYPDVWDLFGGHIEGDESPEDALHREAMEELGIEIESFHLLGTHQDPFEPAEVMVFAVTEWKGKPVNAAPDEHTEIGWFRVDELPASDGLDGYRQMVVQAIAASSGG